MYIVRLSRFVFAFFVLLNIVVGTVCAQEPISNLYCIAVKQSFISGGSCSGHPKYGYANVRINGYNSLQKSIPYDSLNRILTFGLDYTCDNFNKDISKIHNNNILITNIVVNTHASDIKNDKDLEYVFDISNLRFGENAQSRDASDPCSNNANWSGGREWYTMTTTIYIDDPINLTNVNTNTNSSYNIDTDALTLHIGNYYDNGRDERPVLQVKLNNGDESVKWINLSDVIIRPNSSINLSYQRIAGNKFDENSNYFKWMGHRLEFRVVKTLLNGKKTVGQSVTGVVFYPQGIQFFVEDVTRTYCSDSVFVYVRLKESSDKDFFYLNREYFCWKLRDKPGVRFDCYMEATDDPMKYRIRVDKDSCPKDPFNEDKLEPIEWTLQLFNVKEKSYSCDRTFIIPPKPIAIDVAQKHLDFKINGTSYDVPDINHPYAMLNINDSWDLSFKRKPYKIMEGNNELLTLDSLPEDYSKLSATEQKKWDDLFETEFNQMTIDPNDPHNSYSSYFDLKLRQWCQSHSAFGHPLDLETRGHAPVFLPDNSSYLFMGRDEQDYLTWQSDNSYESRYDVYLGSIIGAAPIRLTVKSRIWGDLIVHTNGINYFYVKRDFDGVNYGSFSIYKATKSGGNGVCISEKFTWIKDLKLSPDNNYLYFRGMVNDKEAIYRIPASNDVVNVASKIVECGGISWYYNHLIIPQSGKFFLYTNDKYFVFKYDFNTQISTQLTNVAASSIVIDSNEQFYLYSTYEAGSGRNGRVFKATIGNSIDNGSPLTNDVAFNSYGYIYLLKDNLTFLYTTGPFYSNDLGGGQGSKPDAECGVFYKTKISNTIDNGLKINSAFRTNDWGKLLLSRNEGFTIYDYFIFYKTDDYYDPDTPIYEQYYSLSLFILDVDKSVGEFRNILYPDKGYAQEWYNTYKSIYKKEWLNKKFGIKVSKGIKVNQNQQLRLVDANGCDHPFNPIYVKAPPYADFDSVIVRTPNSCEKNGVAKIVFKGGGTTPYVHSAGTLRNIDDEIIVEGLGYGDNVIQFFDASNNPSATYTIRIDGAVGITDVAITPNTCSKQNGTVTVSVGNIPGTKTYRLKYTDYPYTEYSFSTDNNSYTFPNLRGGSYSAEVISGTCQFTEDNITVGSEIFNIGTITKVDATTLGGSGAVSIPLENNVNGVTWTDAPTGFVSGEKSSNPTYTGIVPGEYSITATHTDASGAACSVAGSFTIHGPEFKASVSLDETDNGFTASARLISSGLISPYKLRLIDASGAVVAEGEQDGAISKLIPVKGDYKFNLQYGYDKNSQTYGYDIDIYTFSYPFGEITNAYKITTPVTCHGGTATIELTPTCDIKDGNPQVSVDGLSYTATRTYTPKGGNFTYNIKSEKSEPIDVQGNTVTVNQSLVKKFVVPIPEPEPVTAAVIPLDVSCASLNNGSIYVRHLKGGSGIYQYRVDEGSWIDTSVTTTGLAPGDYKVYLWDSYNKCSEVQLSPVTIIRPDTLTEVSAQRIIPVDITCAGTNNGKISVALLSGGIISVSSW
jgi:hypothetical protein